MRRPRLLLSAFLGLTVVAAACSPSESASPLEPIAPLASQSLVGGVIDATLLRCIPLMGGSYSAVIGEKGGTLQMGPHSLVIPRSALRQSVRITGEVISDGVNSVRFTPEGLRFRKAARLTLSYHNCPLASLLPVKKVAYTTEGLKLLQILQSLDHPLQKSVTGSLDHFSRYAIAY